jgi:hypothetical protein
MRKPKIVIEYPSRGTTYHTDEYGVYEYSTYPRSSVLAGQQRRAWLDSFPTLEQAKSAYPEARYDGEGANGFIPIAQMVAHIPDDTDY